MSDLDAAVAAGVLGADEAHRALLQATVEVARAIFGAKAASVFLLDEEADELVFEAVAGEGEGELIGMRFPAGNGIAGWVLTTGEPLVVDDLSADTRWSRSQAESTGYVPKSMMSVPLLVDERALGVLSVLDRPTESKLRLAEVDLLGLFANQAAIALDLLQRARRARAALAGEGRLAPLARVAARLEEDERDTAFELLAALDRLLARRPPSPRATPAGRREVTTFSATARVGSCPVTATRNSSLSTAKSRSGSSARTVAVRGTSRSSAISPKKSPGPSSRVVPSSRSTAALPLAMA